MNHLSKYKIIKFADVVFNERKTKPIHGLISRQVYGKDTQGAEKEDARVIEEIFRLMQKSNPEALSTTKVFVGRPSIDDVINQIYDTKHQDDFILDFLGTRDMLASDVSNMTDTALEQFPSSYWPIGDLAVLPESSPGVAMHELGHAIDFNRPRFGGNFRRHMAMGLKPTLLQEHMAWGRGSKALADGVALTDEKDREKARQLAEDVLTEAYHRKGPALGTYWGGALGGSAGAAAGTASVIAGQGEIPGIMIPLAALLGGGLGLATGAFIGKHLYSNDKKAREKARKLLKKRFEIVANVSN